jgi:hypothetical protein
MRLTFRVFPPHTVAMGMLKLVAVGQIMLFIRCLVSQCTQPALYPEVRDGLMCRINVNMWLTCTVYYNCWCIVRSEGSKASQIRNFNNFRHNIICTDSVLVTFLNSPQLLPLSTRSFKRFTKLSFMIILVRYRQGKRETRYVYRILA